MRIIFSSEKAFLKEASFFKKNILSSLGLTYSSSQLQNALAKAYGWTNANELLFHHRKASSPLVLENDKVIDSLTHQELEQLQKKKYLQIYSMIEKDRGRYGQKSCGEDFEVLGFGKFIESIEEKRLGFIAKILGRKQSFKQNPIEFLAQPTSVLSFSSMYEASLHDSLELSMKLNEMAYESSKGSIWINTSARPEDILEILMNKGYSSISSFTFDGNFKLSSELRDPATFLRQENCNIDCAGEIWNKRYKTVLKAVLKVSGDKLSKAQTVKEATSILHLDNFIAELIANKNHGVDEDFITMHTGRSYEDLCSGSQPGMRHYEMWGYCTMQAYPLLMDYFELFDDNGFTPEELFDSKEHVILTSQNDVEHHVLIDVLRRYLALSMGCRLEGAAYPPEKKRISRVINIEQRVEALRIGLSIITAQVRSLGYYSNFYIFKSDGFPNKKSEEELCSMKANTKLKVTRSVDGKTVIQSPFYRAFQQKDFIELDR